MISLNMYKLFICYLLAALDRTAYRQLDITNECNYDGYKSKSIKS